VIKVRATKILDSNSVPPKKWSMAEFSVFYTNFRSELYAHANRILRDPSRAEEITQDAFIKFVLAAPDIESSDHARLYLRRTVENLCIDLIRLEGRRPNLVVLDEALSEAESVWQENTNFEYETHAAEDAAIIRQALALLSPAERSALIMWEVEGRSTKEIAKELKIKESAVRHTVARGRSSMRKILSELVLDEARGLTALDLLSSSYKKASRLAGKSSKIALTFILVLTAFLGLNSLTGNESNTSITTSSAQLSNNQDLPNVVAPVTPEVTIINPKVSNDENSITPIEYADHMQLALNQLETITLMLQVLEQADGGQAPIE